MIGNAQDLSVLSNIDLRIVGKLTDDIKIQAVISDNNLPFQEDGSTYKLQEFDKVYVRIYNDMNELIAGDVELRYLDEIQITSFMYQLKTKDYWTDNINELRFAQTFDTMIIVQEDNAPVQITRTSPFAPAKPRVPVIPRKVSSGLTAEKAQSNKTHCPKCSAQLRRNYDDAECLNCGFVNPPCCRTWA